MRLPTLALLTLLGAACDEAATAAHGGPPLQAHEAFARARQAFAEDRPFDAIEEMRQALATAPDWAAAHLALGKLLLTYSDVRFSTATIDRGRLAEAIEHLERACALAPQDADAAYWAGVGLHKDARNEEAARFIETALRLRPGFAPAVKELGILYADEGDTPRAIARLEEARALLPKDDEVLFRLGMQLEGEERLEEARDAYVRAAELNRGHPGPRSRLIWIYRRLGDEKASEAMQKDFDRCRAFGKEVTAAAQNFDEHSREPEACMRLAELYHGVGMPDEARLWAERALRLDAEYAPARELLHALGEPDGAQAPMDPLEESAR